MTILVSARLTCQSVIFTISVGKDSTTLSIFRLNMCVN